MNGMEMMLKSMGFDMPEIMAKFQAFIDGTKKILESIDAKQERIAKQNEEILAGISRVEERQEKAWQKMLAAERLLQPQSVPMEHIAQPLPPNDQPKQPQ